MSPLRARMIEDMKLAGLAATGTVNLSRRVSRMQSIGNGNQVYCQPMLQISSQTWNVWVLEARCCSAVT
jgi:hypothetical protein